MKFELRAYNTDEHFDFSIELPEIYDIYIDSRFNFNGKELEVSEITYKLLSYDNIMLRENHFFDNIEDIDEVYDNWEDIRQVSYRLQEFLEAIEDNIESVRNLQRLYSYNGTLSTLEFDLSETLDVFLKIQSAVDEINLPDGF